MADKYFLDTNVLLYLINEDAYRTPLAKRLALTKFCISVQILNEFVRVAVKKFKLSPTLVREVLDPIRLTCELFPLTAETHDLAWKIFCSTNIGIYDANIIAAAELAGCDILYSEDMNHGQVIGGVRIINPFLVE